MQAYDVVVVGKGNAALCAALAARDTGASVAMLEAAPVDLSGGNSRFAGGGGESVPRDRNAGKTLDGARADRAARAASQGC